MNILQISDTDDALVPLLTTRLDRDGHHVTVMPSSDDPDSVTQGARTANAVILLTSGWDQQAAISDEARRSALLTALRGSGKRLVYVSDATVVGDTGDSYANEDNPLSTSTAPHPWRVDAERQVMRAVSTGIHSIVVRPALLHGHGTGTLLPQLLASAHTEGTACYIGDGQHQTSTVHVDDLTALISLAVTRASEASIYFAASTEALTWQEIADTVSHTAGNGCVSRSVTAEQATALGLDAATMATSTVIRDDAAHRRLGWAATGPTLAEATSPAE